MAAVVVRSIVGGASERGHTVAARVWSRVIIYFNSGILSHHKCTLHTSAILTTTAAASPRSVLSVRYTTNQQRTQPNNLTQLDCICNEALAHLALAFHRRLGQLGIHYSALSPVSNRAPPGLLHRRRRRW